MAAAGTGHREGLAGEDPAPVLQLHQVREKESHSHPKYEIQKDHLLCGPGHKAVSIRGTRIGVVMKQAWNIKPKQRVLPQQEGQPHKGPQCHVGKVDGQDSV